MGAGVVTAATLTLAEFLLARIAEDEEDYRREERTANPGPWDRLLAECEAKRRIMAGQPYQTADEAAADRNIERWEQTYWLYRLLALPYADHPDYQQEWRP